MIRLLIRLAVHFAAAAIGLIVAAALFDGISVDTLGFIEVALIYAIVLGLLGPFFERQAQGSKSMITGGIGLVTTFVALLITDLISDSLTISGVGTWIGATIVVWLATLVAGLLLPLLVAKRVVDDRRDRR
jgi:uncharacterized membrane protein YvlD (DUF360 family)